MYLNGSCNDVSMTTNCIDILALSVLVAEGDDVRLVNEAWAALLRCRLQLSTLQLQRPNEVTVLARIEAVMTFILSLSLESELKEIFKATFQLLVGTRFGEHVCVLCVALLPITPGQWSIKHE